MFMCLSISVFCQTKPRIWIHTDMTGVTGFKVDGSIATAITDTDSDADDQVAMAMYLMMANQFDTKGIILTSTTRNTVLNTLTKFNEVHGAAYNSDLPCLNSNIGGYPTLAELNVKESSLTEGNKVLSYSNSPVDKYDNFNTLPQTVKDLINELKKPEYSPTNPLYVLIWGPMTEVAMATKHMIRNNMKTELSRMYVVSHWTSSFLNQTGTPCSSFPSDQIQFKPANCNQNCQSCAYMHNEAKKTGASFKFVDLGSIGQEGVVNGSSSFFKGGNNGVGGPQYLNFQKSKLGDLFVKSKFSFGKPDGSDCATFLAVLGTYGVKLSDFNANGVLTKEHEQAGINKFSKTAVTLMQDLNDISNKAISCVTAGPTNINDLIVASSSCTSVSLSWGDVSGEEGYRIRRKTPTTNYIILEDVPANTTSYVDETAAANTTYQYMVRPLKGGVAVAISNTPSITTAICSSDPVPVNTFLKAYPNPTTGLLTLPEVVANDQIKVVNQLSGKTVLIKTITENGSTQLDLTNQPAGNYIIQLIRNNQLLTRQILKL